MPESSNSAVHTPTRRQFLETVATAVATGIAATLAGCMDTLRGTFQGAMVPGHAASPASGKVSLALLTELSATPRSYAVSTPNGGDAVWAYAQNGNVTALSNVCTHRGCAVAWDAGAGSFSCPCHGGVFDLAGKVVSGPPPAPLKSYPTQTTDGVVFLLL